jgi:hypothetical protein
MCQDGALRSSESSTNGAVVGLAERGEDEMDEGTDSGGPLATEPLLGMRRRAGRHALFVVTVFATIISGTSCVETYCAPKGTQIIRPTRAACAWLELEGEPALEVTGLRTTYGEEASCTALKAPGQYRLRRADYAVDFWNGERWYPQLFMRVGPDGRQLRLESPLFEVLSDGSTAIRPKVRAERGDFAYALRPEFRSEFRLPAGRIEFTVIDTSGQELGRESIRVVRKVGGDVRSFY